MTNSYIGRRVEKKKFAYRVAGVDEDGGIRGVLSMTANIHVGRAKRQHVQNICAYVERTGDSLHLGKNLFLCGDAKAINNNWRHYGLSCKAAEVMEFDREYAQYAGNSHGTTKSYTVPVDALGLDPRKIELIAEAREKGEEWLAEINFEDCKENIASFKNTLGCIMVGFPAALINKIKSSGNFYYAIGKKSHQKTSDVELQQARILLSPVGGMPDWARDFVRRN